MIQHLSLSKSRQSVSCFSVWAPTGCSVCHQTLTEFEQCKVTLQAPQLTPQSKIHKPGQNSSLVLQKYSCCSWQVWPLSVQCTEPKQDILLPPLQQKISYVLQSVWTQSFWWWSCWFSIANCVETCLHIDLYTNILKNVVAYKVNYVVTYFITILQYYPIKSKSTQTTAWITLGWQKLRNNLKVEERPSEKFGFEYIFCED